MQKMRQSPPARCRNDRPSRILAHLGIALAAAAALVPARTIAENAIQLPGWHRQFRGAENGAPTAIRAIAQTPDGFIWIGSVNGLYRYDGIAFERVAPLNAKPLQSDAVDSLVLGPRGDLWVGHDWGGLSVVRDGRHLGIKQPLISTVDYLRGSAAGTVWSISIGGPGFVVARLAGRHWVPWIVRKPIGNITQAVSGLDGNLWIIIDGKMYLVANDRATIEQVATPIPSDAALAVDGTGGAVLKTSRGLQVLSAGPHPHSVSVGRPFGRTVARSGGTVVFDGARTFWAIEDEGVLRRYLIDERTGNAIMKGAWKSPYRMPLPEFVQHDLTMLVDREKNLWIGTSMGLERFSPAAFSTIMPPPADSGVEPPVPYALRDGRGTVWVRRLHDLLRAKDDGSLEKQRVDLPVAFTPCTSPKGGIWIPDGQGRLRLFGGAGDRSVSLKDTKLLGTLAQGHCLEDGDGRVWANEALGLERLDQDRARMVSLGVADDGYAVLVMLADKTGDVLAYVGRGSLWRAGAQPTRRVWADTDMTLGLIEVMYQASGYLLIGGDRGIVLSDGRTFRTLTRERLPCLASTTGIVQTNTGETWLQTGSGVVRMRTADLEHAFEDPNYVPPAKTYGPADGLPGPAPSLNMSNITADRQGRIWVSTANGIARYDPQDVPHNNLPPPIVITRLEVGTQTHRAAPKVTLEAGDTRLRIAFAGLSFVNPDAVRFRYQLTGVDPGWVEAGRDRAATYTNLAPGTYRFRVSAANNDGVWNDRPASIELELLPRFYQTWWFLGLCVLLCLSAGWAVYRWRVGQIARRVRNQAAERANERERIARDIHDTLLQSIQGLVLRFQSVATRMERTDPNRSLLEGTLDRADGLIAEGKERVFGLRTEDHPAEMPAMLRLALDEAALQPDVEKVFTVRGMPRLADSAVVREAREIVGEALFNAARHSSATRVSVELDFGGRNLQISVEDNGIGMKPRQDEAPAGRGFGLIGMRERATSVGGRLEMLPGEAAGTVIRLTIPRRRAFPSRTSWRWWQAGHTQG